MYRGGNACALGSQTRAIGISLYMCNHVHHTWMCLTVCLLTYSNGMNLGTAFISFSNVCPRLSLSSQIHVEAWIIPIIESFIYETHINGLPLATIL